MKSFAKAICILLFVNQSLSAQQLPKLPQSIRDFPSKAQQISGMTLSERIKRNIVPARGLCSTAPGTGINDLMLSGSGGMRVDVYGDPLAERVIFRREKIQVPWKLGFEAPKIAYALPEVRRLLLDGKYREGLDYSIKAANDIGFTPGGGNHEVLPAFIMRIETPGTGNISNYLRSTDFESGEVKVLYTNNEGEFERQSFVSGPDSLIVQLLKAPVGKTFSTKILIDSVRGTRNDLHFETAYNENDIIVKGRFITPGTGNTGYAAAVRVVLNGGSAKFQDGALVVENASSIMLLTRIEWYKDFQEDKVADLAASVNKAIPDYDALLARNKKIQSEIFDRASLNLYSTKTERAFSGEELLVSQRAHVGFSPAMLEKMFDMGRYWYMLACGDFPPMMGHLNINVNLQNAGGVMGNLPEASGAYYKWIEGTLDDARTNAKNIFGTRGALYSVHPDEQTGVLYHFDWGWPHHYWISAGGWAYSPFWDHYLATNDKDFLKDQVMPGLRELGLFYEDFLSTTDKAGNYIFVPSYSPENWPAINQEGERRIGEQMLARGGHQFPPVALNATMDIMVCREVLTHLIEGAQILGTDKDKIPVWQAMLSKMPPYLTDFDGSLKEWTWPTLGENVDHRHISQMYGVWPADEIDPDRTPELAKAAWLANRKRSQGNNSGHGISHRMLAAARLKDNHLVNFELKQLLEEGYIGPTLTASHNPYTTFFPDQQGSILTVLMEMLVYSREGVLEVLPALPESLQKGSINGILTRSFAKINTMRWDLKAKTVDLTIISLKKQTISLLVRYGIASITAEPGVLPTQPKADAGSCILNLPANKAVSLHIKLGDHKPSDWILASGALK